MRVSNNSPEKNALVLQGGGALGAYQAGAYEALAGSHHQPDWIAGISIGAINAAIIAGNAAESRLEKLNAFWEQASSALSFDPWLDTPGFRNAFTELAAASVMTWGVPGFFNPRFPTPAFMPYGSAEAQSYYDTSPLKATLETLVDFDYLNSKGSRLSVGAVDVETGNFTYFDSKTMRIGPEHIMASGALPPGFPAVEINGREYWAGGLVSNTPLQYVMESCGTGPLCIFQVDLFSARGARPGNLVEVAQRDKDIRYSSRTRLTTDRFRQMYEIGAAANRLRDKLPKELQDDSDLQFLLDAGPQCPVALMHLIHRKEEFEGQSKDYEFSRISMKQHWVAGIDDTTKSLNHRLWKNRKRGDAGLQVFDLTAAE